MCGGLLVHRHNNPITPEREIQPTGPEGKVQVVGCNEREQALGLDNSPDDARRDAAHHDATETRQQVTRNSDRWQICEFGKCRNSTDQKPNSGSYLTVADKPPDQSGDAHPDPRRRVERKFVQALIDEKQSKRNAQQYVAEAEIRDLLPVTFDGKVHRKSLRDHLINPLNQNTLSIGFVKRAGLPLFYPCVAPAITGDLAGAKQGTAAPSICGLALK